MVPPILTQRSSIDVIPHHDRRCSTLLAGGDGRGAACRVARRRRAALDARACGRRARRRHARLPRRAPAAACRCPYFESRRTADIERRLNGLQPGPRSADPGEACGAAPPSIQLDRDARDHVPLLVAADRARSTSPARPSTRCSCASPRNAHPPHLRRRRDRPRRATSRGRSTPSRASPRVKAMGAEDGLRRRMHARVRASSRDKLFRADLRVDGLRRPDDPVVDLPRCTRCSSSSAPCEVLARQPHVGSSVAFNALVLLANAPLLALLGALGPAPARRGADGAPAGRDRAITPEQGHDHSELQRRASELGSRSVCAASASPIPEPPTTPDPRPTSRSRSGRARRWPWSAARARASRRWPSAWPVCSCRRRERSSTTASICASCDFGELRRRIGFVLQESYLFDDTIAAQHRLWRAPCPTSSAACGGPPSWPMPPSSSRTSRSRYETQVGDSRSQALRRPGSARGDRPSAVSASRPC